MLDFEKVDLGGSCVCDTAVTKNDNLPYFLCDCCRYSVVYSTVCHIGSAVSLTPLTLVQRGQSTASQLVLQSQNQIMATAPTAQAPTTLAPTAPAPTVPASTLQNGTDLYILVYIFHSYLNKSKSNSVRIKKNLNPHVNML
jgi:hypothetical protein